jgi:hypothetical protein
LLSYHRDLEVKIRVAISEETEAFDDDLHLNGELLEITSQSSVYSSMGESIIIIIGDYVEE